MQSFDITRSFTDSTPIICPQSKTYQAAPQQQRWANVKKFAHWLSVKPSHNPLNDPQSFRAGIHRQPSSLSRQIIMSLHVINVYYVFLFKIIKTRLQTFFIFNVLLIKMSRKTDKTLLNIVGYKINTNYPLLKPKFSIHYTLHFIRHFKV